VAARNRQTRQATYLRPDQRCVDASHTRFAVLRKRSPGMLPGETGSRCFLEPTRLGVCAPERVREGRPLGRPASRGCLDGRGSVRATIGCGSVVFHRRTFETPARGIVTPEGTRRPRLGRARREVEPDRAKRGSLKHLVFCFDRKQSYAKGEKGRDGPWADIAKARNL
jgi:hypothetical protein